MAFILDAIVEEKRREVAELKRSGIRIAKVSAGHRPFRAAIDRRPLLSVIAEVKKASPSRGVIADDFVPVAIARAYEMGGASAVSVLTDRRFFKGDIEYLIDVRAGIGLPVLRKDFIIDPVQVEQTACMGADAMLLIAAILSDAQMAELYATARQAGIEPLIEIHNEPELERVMALSPEIIGINNRDLRTFECHPQTTVDLMKRIPSAMTVVSESGISTGAQTRELVRAGVSAVLVGESLMHAAQPGVLIRELVHADPD